MVAADYAKMAVSARFAGDEPRLFVALNAVTYLHAIACADEADRVEALARPLLSQVIFVEGAKTLG
jgi:tetraacyldisaccharide-1-P 4'-kinase